MNEKIYCLLAPHIALRSWRLVPHAYYIRGVRNAQNLTAEEFYDVMVEFSRGYAAKPHRMHIDIWQFLNIFPQTKQYNYRPVFFGEGEYRDSYPICGTAVVFPVLQQQEKLRPA